MTAIGIGLAQFAIGLTALNANIKRHLNTYYDPYHLSSRQSPCKTTEAMTEQPKPMSEPMTDEAIISQLIGEGELLEPYYFSLDELKEGLTLARASEREALNGWESSINWPTEKQLVDVAILFNDGELDADKLGDMVGMSMFILDRLRENGDVKVPSSKERTDMESPQPPTT